jgi:aspartate-semialdehyde dehydrogenase
MLGNVIPFIKGEEKKIETELKKIFGEVNTEEINDSQINVSAHCNRVPVIDGHTLTISLKLKNSTTVEDIKRCFQEFTPNLNLPTYPKNLFDLRTECNRPQPRIDLNKGNGMSITIGRIRECSILDFKLVTVGHNRIRGAAGGSILNAELCIQEGLIK